MNTHEVLSKMFASYKTFNLFDSGIIQSSVDSSMSDSLSLSCSNIIAQSLTDSNSLQSYQERLKLHQEEDQAEEELTSDNKPLLKLHFTLARVALETWVTLVWAWRMMSRYHGALLYALLAGLIYGTIRGIFVFDVGDTGTGMRVPGVSCGCLR